jgi:hypothetical protein
MSDDDPFMGEQIPKAASHGLDSKTNIASMQSPRFVHESLGDIATLSRVIRGNDDVALLDEGKWPLPSVVKSFVI